MLKYKILTIINLFFSRKAIDIQANIPEKVGILLGYKIFIK